MTCVSASTSSSLMWKFTLLLAGSDCFEWGNFYQDSGTGILVASAVTLRRGGRGRLSATGGLLRRLRLGLRDGVLRLLLLALRRELDRLLSGQIRLAGLSRERRVLHEQYVVLGLLVGR